MSESEAGGSGRRHVVLNLTQEEAEMVEEELRHFCEGMSTKDEYAQKMQTIREKVRRQL